ncbi:MAG: hypothetical protein QF775_04010, partial [archaeon]|nr:hypothetical protein [archaeon]
MKILITDPISKEAAKEIGEMGELELAPAISPEELLEKIADVEILVVRSRTKVTSELISSAKNLKAVIRAGVGLDNIDMERRGENEYNRPQNLTTRRFIFTQDSCISLIHTLFRDNILNVHAVCRSSDVVNTFTSDVRYLHY